MNHTDEDLQKKIDRGVFSDEGIDAQAYQKVFEALKREPEYSLPTGFADHIINLVEVKEKTKEVSRDNLWFGLGLLSFIIALVVAFALTDFKLSVGAFRFFSGYPGLIVFGIAFILFLQWLDKKIFRQEASVSH